MTDLDEQTLDRIEAELWQAQGRENAITSGEIAAKHLPDDGEANPQTRKAIKTLMRERGTPVIGESVGYYIPTSNEPISDAVQSLQSRIEGIKERQKLIMDNWKSHQMQSETAGLDPEQVQKIKNDPTLEISDYDDFNNGANA